jgi:carboxyl-terminal processing protease
MRIFVAATLIAAGAAAASADPLKIDYSGDAKALDQIIIENYAYEDHWPGGRLPDSPQLEAESAAVHDADSLLHYAEDRIASLADHHAITGSSFKDSWAIVPTYADLWVEHRPTGYVITAVKEGSPAEKAGVSAGDRLVAVDGVDAEQAISGFWKGLGLAETPERNDYAARVLGAGRRDRPRHLTIYRDGISRQLTLPNLYSSQPDVPPLTVSHDRNGRTVIRFNNSIGDQGTIAAFDEAMALLPSKALLVLDLTDTPSGGNTSVARAIMSWFVDRPRSYQVHQLPSEQRETGIARQWIEQVLPRTGKLHRALPTVEVGRWTGSMGEGIAIGFAALGAKVEGTRMAQLKGAVYDFKLPSSGLVVKFPAERLYTVAGVPREDFVPRPRPRR